MLLQVAHELDDIDKDGDEENLSSVAGRLRCGSAGVRECIDAAML